MHTLGRKRSASVHDISCTANIDKPLVVARYSTISKGSSAPFSVASLPCKFRSVSTCAWTILPEKWNAERVDHVAHGSSMIAWRDFVQRLVDVMFLFCNNFRRFFVQKPKERIRRMPTSSQIVCMNFMQLSWPTCKDPVWTQHIQWASNFKSTAASLQSSKIPEPIGWSRDVVFIKRKWYQDGEA